MWSQNNRPYHAETLKKKQFSLSGESLTKEGIYIAFPSTYSELNKKMDMRYADGLD